ncbi:neurogenic locus notch homolog protein 3-like [Panicum virgatum]|uniref:neurogenic locus notch homolog protein 3-like n=1 Tax=Panicum virgatum TaxID=38727 RepID=UPI0019D537F0|nr:neurogenic locus notch homolog protein 3-like [Panicum virgatum]
MVPVPVGVPAAVAAMVLAGLACAEVAGGGGQTICDTAKCGKGSCNEMPGWPLPLFTTSYNCTCDPGWSQPRLFNLTPLPFAPCIVPDCPFDPACYNISLVPRGIPFTDPCVAINCGAGECKRGEGLSYTCECQEGYVNFLNLTAFPCVKNCAFGVDCSKLGVAPPPAPTPSTAPPPLPPGNHDSSAPPTGPKGNDAQLRLDFTGRLIYLQIRPR